MESKGKFRPGPNLKLMDQVRHVLRYHHYAYRTEQTYCDWIEQYIKFHKCKKHPGEMGKTEMGLFAQKLHDGELVVKEPARGPILSREEKLSYNKRQFYDRILTPMRGMGLIDYDLYKKTYKLSEKFNRMMMKIGLMWLREMERK